MHSSNYLLCSFSDYFNAMFCFSGQILRISTLFRSGNVVFRWTPSSNSSYYYVFITRDRITDARTHVYDSQYTVKDAILYDSITINVRTPESLADNVVTYNGLIIFFYIYIHFWHKV